MLRRMLHRQLASRLRMVVTACSHFALTPSHMRKVTVAIALRLARRSTQKFNIMVMLRKLRTKCMMLKYLIAGCLSFTKLEPKVSNC